MIQRAYRIGRVARRSGRLRIFGSLVVLWEDDIWLGWLERYIIGRALGRLNNREGVWTNEDWAMNKVSSRLRQTVCTAAGV